MQPLQIQDISKQVLNPQKDVSGTHSLNFGFGSQTTVLNFGFGSRTTLLNFGLDSRTTEFIFGLGSPTTVLNFGFVSRTTALNYRLGSQTTLELGLVVRLQYLTLGWVVGL